jgi:hypothetical protein
MTAFAASARKIAAMVTRHRTDTSLIVMFMKRNDAATQAVRRGRRRDDGR